MYLNIIVEKDVHKEAPSQPDQKRPTTSPPFVISVQYWRRVITNKRNKRYKTPLRIPSGGFDKPSEDTESLARGTAPSSGIRGRKGPA